jgi:hypothetical protein
MGKLCLIKFADAVVSLSMMMFIWSVPIATVFIAHPATAK